MSKFKKLFNLKIVSLTVSVLFLFTSTPYAQPVSKDSLRVQHQLKTEKGVGRFQETAVRGFYRLKSSDKILDREVSLKELENVKEYYRWYKVFTPYYDEFYNYDNAKKLIEEGKLVAGTYDGKFCLFVVSPLITRGATHMDEVIIVKGVFLDDVAASLREPIGFYKEDENHMLRILDSIEKNGIDPNATDKDVAAVSQMLNEKEYPAKDLINMLKKGNNVERRRALVAVHLRGGMFSSEGRFPTMTRRDFLLKAAAASPVLIFAAQLIKCKDLIEPPTTDKKTYNFIEAPLPPQEAAMKAAEWIKNNQLYRTGSGWAVISYGNHPNYGSDGIDWSFDQGTTMVVFSQIEGEYLEIAKSIGDRVIAEQKGDGLWERGRLGQDNAQKKDKLVGDIVTVGRGLVEVGLKTLLIGEDPKENKYIKSAIKAADGLNAFWNDKGYFTGGTENNVNVKWVSTEQNARAGIFFYRLYKATKDYSYYETAQKIANWLKTDMWTGEKFHVGYDEYGNINTTYGQDLDAQLMPIIFFNISGEDAINFVGSFEILDDINFKTLAYIDKTYKKGISFKGTNGKNRTVSLYGKVKGVNHIWLEGSANVAAVCEAWGGDFMPRRDEILNDIAKLLYAEGGLAYTLAGQGSDNSITWPNHYPLPSVASTVAFTAAALLGPEWFPVDKRRLRRSATATRAGGAAAIGIIGTGKLEPLEEKIEASGASRTRL